MAAPFEDEIVKYIASKRPLKLAFLFVAAVGVVGSAFTTARPLLTGLQPLAYRLLGIAPPDEVRDRYKCAYYAGASQWDLPKAVRLAQSQTQEVVAKTIHSYQVKLTECGSLLGYSLPSVPPAVTAERVELARIQAAVEYSLHSLSGSLASRDRASHAFFRIGSAAANVVTQMAPVDPEERRINAALSPFELEIGHELERALTEARRLCLCRIPALDVKTASRNELVASATAVDEALTELLTQK